MKKYDNLLIMKTKTRLTITLSQELLNKVDALVDGYAVRNRSHAIENLVRAGVGNKISIAVLLAGGTRKDDITPSLKKINDRYILSLVIDQLKKFGITKLVICAGSNEAKIKKIFQDGSAYGISIVYSLEKKALGSAGAIKKAQKLVGSSEFLVINDNSLADINLEDLFAFHLSENSLATICVRPRMSEKKYGQAFLNGNKIVKFLDVSQNEGISIINIGIYVLSPSIFELIEANRYISLEKDIFPRLVESKELSAFVFQGSWLDVSRDDEKLNSW